MIATETVKKISFNFNGENTNYSTHSFHPYPAKFPPQLPKRIIEEFAVKGQTILDPFCGSGTTLVEAKLFGLNSIGVDVNGLSALLSEVKTTPLIDEEIKEIETFLSSFENDLLIWKSEIRSQSKIKEIEGVDHWFQTNVAEELTYIIDKINIIEDRKINSFLKICLSAIIVKVSNQDSDTRFAAINKSIRNGYTIGQFINKVSDYVPKIVEFSKKSNPSTKVTVYNADSRNLSFIAENSVDIIITSPPYANTYDYYLYHKFRKRWLDLDVKFAQYNEIGSRREYSSLKEKPEKWNEDLKICFKEMNRVLKPSHFAFIVIGDSVIKKELIKIEKQISNFVSEIGFKINNIISSDLSSHSRIFNPTFAKKGKKEHLIILQKY